MEDKKYTRHEQKLLRKQGKKCCARCNEVKPLEEFTTGGKLKSGATKYTICFVCSRIKSNKNYDPQKKKEYYIDNKERIQEYRKTYYLENKEKSAIDSKRWREQNKEYYKEYRKNKWLENKEEISKRNKRWREQNKERISEKSKKYREENKERLSKQRKEYYKENRERLSEKSKKYREENRELIRERNNNRYKKRLETDEIFRIKESIRKTIYDKIKGNKKFSTCEILGCDYEVFKVYIENQFQEGMTWENHGQFGWHYDHIIPASSAETEEELYQLNHYTNFQPLWWNDNLSKSDKLDWEQVED